MKTLKDYEYFRTENGVLYCGDNMEIFPLITEPVELCLTDPPYGINIEKMSYANNENKKASKNSKAKRTAYEGGFKDDKIDIKLLLNYPKQIIWCIEKSKTKGVILDPFMGSGTTALACEKLNRRWIGIEISEKYCEIAKKRIEEYTNQLKLFK